MKHVTVRQALQNVADSPLVENPEPINAPVHELVARTLFDIANNPEASVRGSMTKANKARKILLDRMVGRRRPGTTPHREKDSTIPLMDLTTYEVGGPSDGPE